MIDRNSFEKLQELGRTVAAKSVEDPTRVENVAAAITELLWKSREYQKWIEEEAQPADLDDRALTSVRDLQEQIGEMAATFKAETLASMVLNLECNLLDVSLRLAQAKE